MNPIALYFASGESLYAGSALMLLLVALTPFAQNRWLRRLHSLLIWIALAMMAMACPPFPWAIDAFFFAAFIAWLIAWSSFRKSKPRRIARIITASLFTLLLIVLPLCELPYRARPVFTGTLADHLVVIGDSISAGIDPAELPWPAVLQQQSGIPVTNLAFPGDTVANAIKHAQKLAPADTLLLIEIGGNDLIGGTSSATFRQDLDHLLEICAAPARTIIMFELPLLPHRIAYGRIQRELAAKYHVQLIPKRFFIDVLAGKDATSDSLHLAPAGAKHMAESVYSLLAPLLKNSTCPAKP
jgi:acyl-CoA thioesterase-1